MIPELIILFGPVALAIVLLILRCFKSAILMMLVVPAAVLAVPGNEGAALILLTFVIISWIAIGLLLIDSIKWKYLDRERAKLNKED